MNDASWEGKEKKNGINFTNRKEEVVLFKLYLYV